MEQLVSELLEHDQLEIERLKRALKGYFFGNTNILIYGNGIYEKGAKGFMECLFTIGPWIIIDRDLYKYGQNYIQVCNDDEDINGTEFSFYYLTGSITVPDDVERWLIQVCNCDIDYLHRKFVMYGNFIEKVYDNITRSRYFKICDSYSNETKYTVSRSEMNIGYNIPFCILYRLNLLQFKGYPVISTSKEEYRIVRPQNFLNDFSEHILDFKFRPGSNLRELSDVTKETFKIKLFDYS